MLTSCKPPSVIKYAPRSGVVPGAPLLKEESCDVAEPTKEVIDLTSDHWADLVVTAESDEEEFKSGKADGVQEKGCYECNLCIYRSGAAQLLVRHMSRKHTFMDGNYFVCGFCKFKCTEDKVIEQHILHHFPRQYIDDSWKATFANSKKKWNRAERAVLEEAFRRHQFVGRETKLEIANKLKVDVKRVQIWFNNRRKNVLHH